MTKRTPRTWARLDNAAKIFPPSATGRDTRVFRFACQLREPVDPAVLQKALDHTLTVFPFFRVILRRGLFWPYLEECELEAIVHEEDRPICQRFYDPNVKCLLFDVSYFGKRINLEIFHVLTDGTGALQFLQRLVYDYLTFKHDYDPATVEPLPYSASNEEKNEDSFARHYKPGHRKKGNKHIVAYQEHYPLLPEARLEIIEGHLSAAQALAKAKSYHVSLTEYFCAVMLLAYRQNMTYRDYKRPIALSVPVNLRQFFDSATARNFFSIITIRYQFTEEEPQFTDILASVQQQFKTELTREKLEDRMTALMSLERNPFIRIVPLFIKNWFLNIANNFAAREVSSSISNVGKITMPAFCQPHIERFDVFMSTQRTQLCLCSFGDELTLSFTTAFASTQMPTRFFRLLAAEGMEISISSSLRDNGYEDSKEKSSDTKKQKARPPKQPKVKKAKTEKVKPKKAKRNLQ